MDFHLERGLRLHTEPEDKSLYAWAINEIDPRVGRSVRSNPMGLDVALHRNVMRTR